VAPVQGELFGLSVVRVDGHGMELNLASAGIAEVSLFGALGEPLEQRIVAGSLGHNKLEWSRPLARGVHFARVRQGGELRVVQFTQR